MPTFIAVYRTINTEIWQVEAPNSVEAERNFMQQGHMICQPLFEDSVELRRAGTFVIREGEFPKVRQIG